MGMSIAYHGLLGGPRSMGRVGQRLLDYLRRHPGYEAFFLPYGNDYFADEWDDAVKACLVTPGDRQFDKAVHFCSVLDHKRVEGAKQSVKWMYYELHHVPDVLAAAISANDLVLATSTFVKQVFLESKFTAPVRVLGHGYDPVPYQYQRRSMSDPFTFLCVAEHTPRKNLPVLLECFANAFNGRKDTRLILKLGTHGSGNIRDHIKHTDCVDILTDFITTEAELAALYHQAHCFVLPTRGEGFGMPILEAMATGLPVIVTRYGGHLDFCDDTTAYLIQNRGLVESDPRCFPFIQSQWADPDPDHLIHLLREVRESYPAALDRAEKAHARVAVDWTWDAQFAREFP